MELLRKKVLELIKKRALASGKVYVVDLYSIDEDFYREYLEYYDENPNLKRLRPHADKRIEENVRTMKLTRGKTIAIYYCNGQYRELITDMPICGIKECIEVDPATGKNFKYHIVYGQEEPLFFIFSDFRNLFEYGCEDLIHQVPRKITDDEKEYYYILHNNPDFFRLELESDKANARVKYNNVLLDFAHDDLELEKTYQKQRAKIVCSKNEAKQSRG